MAQVTKDMTIAQVLQKTGDCFCFHALWYALPGMPDSNRRKPGRGIGCPRD